MERTNGNPQGETAASSRGSAARRPPRHLRIVNPLRVLLFWPALFVLVSLFAAYRTIVLDIPSALSRRFRSRHLRRFWNGLISFWGAGILRLTRLIVGLEVRVDGTVPAGPHIVVANHQSTADIIVLIGALRGMNLKFVVKNELSRFVPNVSSAVRRGGFGVVDFSDPQGSLRRLIPYARGLADWNGSPVIYPEGIRTLDGSIRPFRSAGLRLLVRETGLPVLPVVIDGLWRARTIADFTFHLPGSVCRVQILPVISAEDATSDLDGLAGRLERSMRDELARMRGEPAPTMVGAG